MTPIDIKGSVSERLWIYFAVMIPLTGLVLGLWWTLDQRSHKADQDEEDEADRRLMIKIETQTMGEIRKRTGARVGTDV